MHSSTLARSADGPAPSPFARQAGARPAAARHRLAGMWRGPADDPMWARPALLALLALTLATYTWQLTASGWANSFYSAAAQAGSQSWEAFFYGASDASGAITVDKPPASLWVMALSVRLLGLSSLSILLPQALMGVATTGVVVASVKRVSGAGAGLLAGAVFALTPVAVLMFRFNNPDALLVLLMALAAWATVHAVERGSVRWMGLVGVLVGLGFLTKTFQVLLVVPPLGLAWLVAARTTGGRRVLGGLVAAAAAVLSAGWWVAVVELVPQSMRPYVGGSQSNSFLELTFGYNGLGRINGEETGSVGGGGGWGETGIGRMFSSTIGGQISWLVPTALVLLVAGLWLRGRAPRTDLRRAAYVVWGGWLVVTALTFSFMAGIFHEYYTVALGPAVAALVGTGAAEAWQVRDRRLGRAVLAVSTATGAVWSFVLLSRTTAYGDWLRVTVLVLGLAAALALLVLDRLHRRAVAAAASAAVVALLLGPAAYSATTISQPHTGSIVTAGPSTGRGGPGGGGPGGGAPGGPGGQAGGIQAGPGGQPGTGGGQAPQGTAPGGATPGGAPQGGGGGGMGGLLDATTPSTQVVAALSADASQYRWVAAAVGSQNAAGLQLATELPVMAIGGFNGSDPSPTLAQFEQYVADGQIHYLLAGSGMGGSGSGSAAQILEWVSTRYEQVSIDGQSFYDLTSPLTSSTATDAS